MIMSSKRKRIAIIISWLLFLAVMNICFFNLEKNIYSRTVKKELAEQAAAVSKQVAPIVENDLFTEVAAIRVEAAKLKSLAFALEDYDDIQPAIPLLEDFYNNAGFSGLTIYDREGKILYSKGTDDNSQLLSESGEAIREILDEKVYALIEDELKLEVEDVGYVLSTMAAPRHRASYFWGVGDRWLISMIDTISSAEAFVLDHFSKDLAIRSISVGKTGYLVTINRNSEKIVNSHFGNTIGEHMKYLEINAGREITTVADLESLFSNSDDVVQLSVSGDDCYAYKLDFHDALVLLLLPTAEIRDKVNTSTITLIILIVFVTGLAVLYAFFHSDDADDSDEGEPVQQEGSSKRRSFWNRTMSGKMRVIGILCVIGVFAGVVYLELLSIYAETFGYTESKVNKVVNLLDEDETAMLMLQEWCNEESITRSRIAKCIIDHTDPDRIDWLFLSALSDSLGVEYIYRFDRDGNIAFTNSPFTRLQVREGSEFYPLLEGKSELVLPQAYDSLSGQYLQNAGTTIFDENNRSDGFVLVSLNPVELSKVRNNLGFKFIFEQLGLSDGSYVFAVKEDDMTISFSAFVENKKLETDIESYEYTGMKVTELGIDEKVVRDNYNGNVLLFENRYFASIQRVEDIYYIVMRPQMRLGLINIIPAAFSTGVSLLFMIALTFLSSIGPETAQEQIPVAPSTNGKRSKAHKDKDILSMLGQVFEKKKPYFEDRWPNDSKRWRDRTSGEKFISSAEYLVLGALLFIYLHAKLAGSRSIWYYCVAGKWETGINLYSVTTCILSICMLIIVKIIVHKLLYLAAKAVDSKGETICHLMDNFSGYALVIAGIFICLHHFGVNATALSLTGGIAGVIFGLGCQNMVADILSGLIMAFSGEVRVGDFVSYNGNYGTILSVGIRTTKLKWFGEVTLVRNNEFKNVMLFGAKETRRVVSCISIDLKESLERVEKIVEKELPTLHDNLAKKATGLLNGPIYRGVDAITQDGTTLSFILFCQSPDFMLFIREMNRELKMMCERNNINLAMHQVVVNEPEDYSKTEK